MRGFFDSSLIVLLLFAAAFAQDTNFATGPQYLMTHGSPMFARPISTPTMTLSGPPLHVGADNATGILSVGADNQTVLPPLAVALPQIDLFTIYYGVKPASVIEINSPQASQSALNNVPASISDTGVGQVTTAEALRERGYGIPLAEAASYARVRGHATHIYTNADIERLHTGM
ncbi:MAG: hypothetical protein WBV69_05650 [Candidatus Sulfotelmatobacter sp.]